MWFVDQATITVKAGDGGRGCAAYAQPPYTRAPYPDGGDGGDGGDVVLEADPNIATLLDFQFRHEFQAERGAHGSGNNRTGRCGAEVVIRVPVGTLVRRKEAPDPIRDLTHGGERFVVAHGGRGGRGNANAPEATDGRPGERLELLLELKLIADVGLLGFPNAGKSSLLSRVSSARPKVAAYAFTTKFPVLGVVSPAGREPFVMCDIPGLIEGAHEGKGLGLQFLRHVERTRLLVHVVDMAGTEGRDPVEAFYQVNAELAAYSAVLAERPQVIAANKMDLPEAQEHLARFRQQVEAPVWPVSCATGQGLPELLAGVADALVAVRASGEAG